MFYGLLFHDDALLSDFEDANSDALRTYRAWGLPDNIGVIRDNPELLNMWTEKKTQFLIDWTLELKQRVAKYRPQIKTARNIYAQVILNPQSRNWFAQDLDRFVEHYDYTAIMAMPYMEQADNPSQWLKTLARTALQSTGSAEKLLFELQSKDWRNNVFVEEQTLINQIQILQDQGIVHYGYYPDDFIAQRPSIDSIFHMLSLKQEVEY
jgi:biofilm PGA synthesis lipoprotein PgaB